jgi:hypothetical protein
MLRFLQRFETMLKVLQSFFWLEKPDRCDFFWRRYLKHSIVEWPRCLSPLSILHLELSPPLPLWWFPWALLNFSYKSSPVLFSLTWHYQRTDKFSVLLAQPDICLFILLFSYAFFLLNPINRPIELKCFSSFFIFFFCMEFNRSIEVKCFSSFFFFSFVWSCFFL